MLAASMAFECESKITLGIGVFFDYATGATLSVGSTPRWLNAIAPMPELISRPRGKSAMWTNAAQGGSD
jgi:hypothetical protein